MPWRCASCHADNEDIFAECAVCDAPAWAADPNRPSDPPKRPEAPKKSVKVGLKSDVPVSKPGKRPTPDPLWVPAPEKASKSESPTSVDAPPKSASTSSEATGTPHPVLGQMCVVAIPCLLLAVIMMVFERAGPMASGGSWWGWVLGLAVTVFGCWAARLVIDSSVIERALSRANAEAKFRDLDVFIIAAATSIVEELLFRSAFTMSHGLFGGFLVYCLSLTVSVLAFRWPVPLLPLELDLDPGEVWRLFLIWAGMGLSWGLVWWSAYSVIPAILSHAVFVWFVLQIGRGCPDSR